MYKKIILFLFSCFILTSFCFAMKVEDIKPTDYVTDYTQTLTSEQVLEISKILGQVEREKNYPVAVVVVPTIEDEFGHADYIEHFATKLYEKLGLGTKEKDEGLLWLISKDTREMRMEVGYGLEPILTDSITKNIQDNFVRPEFKSGNYYGGVKVGVEKISEVLNGGTLPEPQNTANSFDWFSVVIFIFIFGINILGWLFAIIARTKSWWLGGVATFVIGFPVLYFGFGLNAVGDLILFVFTMTGFLFDYFISKNYKYWQEKMPMTVNGQPWDENHKPAWWAGGAWGPGSGGFSGRGGSGFGGFGGGGMSGGGGSSSSW